MRAQFLAATLILLSACNRSDEAPKTPDVDPHLKLNTLLVDRQCSNCHAADYQRVGPSMVDLAAYLAPQGEAGRIRIRDAILKGAKGNFGKAVMPPQTQVTPEQADELARAILASAPAEAKN